MDANPYAPPAANVVDREPDSHGLKRRSVVLMLVLTVVTLGVYYIVWFFRRRPGLNRLDSSKKVELWPLLLWIAWFVLEVIVSIAAGDSPVQVAFGSGFALALRAGQFAVGIVMVIQCFRIKDIIEDHAAPADSSELFAERVSLSGIMTFFFSIFYLQWAINRYVVKPQ